jgi:two-component system OmpR family sensor kinase
MRSIASRVAWVALTSAALGGLAAAIVAILAVDRLIADAADQRLRAATVTLAGELDEEGKETPEKVRATVIDENDEIVTSGIRLAVFREGKLDAGDAFMFAPAAGACESRMLERGRVRACASPYRKLLLVAAQPLDEAWLYWLYGCAVFGAVVLGAGTGALSSRTLSRWAVDPLDMLARALRSSMPGTPTQLKLGPPSEYEEIEAVRSALSDLTLRLQVQLDQATRFAADAAHELRTPLTALRAELELLTEERPESDRPALERACMRVKRLGALVDRLLVLALPSENLRQGFEAVALADLAEEVRADLSEAERARVNLKLSDDGLVRGDPRLLASLIANALGNALKFAPDGAIELCVESRTDIAGQHEVRLEIRDQGPGIPPELRDRVFQPFYRMNAGTVAGHGLGLALIAHIARAHSGSVEFEGGQPGSRLVVQLPAWTASDATA